MKAITVEPHKAKTAHLEDVPDPDVHGGSVLVEAIAVGVCGTDWSRATLRRVWPLWSHD
jgi:D-arabinose 1-dehydrogenase-like Zn-dependent alcohol dehydrogenase